MKYNTVKHLLFSIDYKLHQVIVLLGLVVVQSGPIFVLIKSHTCDRVPDGPYLLIGRLLIHYFLVGHSVVSWWNRIFDQCYHLVQFDIRQCHVSLN